MIWISPDWNVNTSEIKFCAIDDLIWISPDWNVNNIRSIEVDGVKGFEYHQIGM